MRTPLTVIGLLTSAFLGGAFAQSFGGGIQLALAQGWFIFSAAVSGTPVGHSCTAGNQCNGVNQLIITSDTQTAAGVQSAAFDVERTISAGATGNMQTIASYMSISGQPGGAGDANYVGSQALIGASVTDGGSLGAEKGSIWGINPNAILASGATSWKQVYGAEFNVTVATGASVRDKFGIAVVKGSLDAVKSTKGDLGITLNNQSGATGWDCGFCFGSYSGQNPMATTGTLIGTFNNAGSVGGGAMGTVVNGVDFRQYTFTGTPFGAPLITPASSSAACVTGGIEWDASFIYICTSTNTWKRATLASF